jgi:hypothetical protein
MLSIAIFLLLIVFWFRDGLAFKDDHSDGPKILILSRTVRIIFGLVTIFYINVQVMD